MSKGKGVGVNYSELPPSKQWATLKYRGQRLAQVWFKPDGDPFALVFRIPQENFHVAGLAEQLTIENLLKAVAIAPELVDSWRQEETFGRNAGGVGRPVPSAFDSGTNASHPDLQGALPPPPPHVAHLDIHVRLKPPETRGRESGVRNQGSGNQRPDSSSLTPDSCLLTPESCPLTPDSIKWQDFEARWKAILGWEATTDSFRISVEGLLLEMESSLSKTLSIEEKSYALRADIAQWERAKNRVHFALPKMRDFVHRATWAMGSPERKRLQEVYKDHIQPHVPFPQMDELLRQLEELQKDRQVLSALGKTVYQDSKRIAADVQGALRTLQNNANTRKIKAAGASKGRFFT